MKSGCWPAAKPCSLKSVQVIIEDHRSDGAAGSKTTIVSMPGAESPISMSLSICSARQTPGGSDCEREYSTSAVAGPVDTHATRTGEPATEVKNSHPGDYRSKCSDGRRDEDPASAARSRMRRLHPDTPPRHTAARSPCADAQRGFMSPRSSEMLTRSGRVWPDAFTGASHIRGRHRRVLTHHIRGAISDFLPEVQNRNPIGQLENEAEFMLDQNLSDSSLFLDIQQVAGQIFSLLLIETRRGFIEEEEFGLHAQGPPEFHTLKYAVGRMPTGVLR